MYVILSQRIDTESSYEDSVFKLYHYPSRYKNQLHVGDTFIYYQGNRYKQEQRYYFGTGTIAAISTEDGKNFYAELKDCIRFPNNVPIYYEGDVNYIEQLEYQTVRKSINPPWQSSIRPLSKEAYDYIISRSGLDAIIEAQSSVFETNELLKNAVREYFRDKNSEAITRIREYSTMIEKEINCTRKKVKK
ncbi:MAG: hypothetical protein K6F23_03040 [Solobacterium sp.]|nr:hypothetical protein [Solobacterium sp.]